MGKDQRVRCVKENDEDLWVNEVLRK